MCIIAALEYSRSGFNTSPSAVDVNAMPRARSLRTLSITTQSTSNARMASPTLDGPPSPTMSDATNASQLNFGLSGPEKIITRTDLRNSLQAFETVSGLGVSDFS